MKRMVFYLSEAKEAEIAAKVQEVAKSFAPDVVQIRYKIDEDWTGDPIIRFQVVLSDKASSPKRLYTTAAQIKKALRNLFDYAELGLWPTSAFRSLSEHKSIKDPAWE